MTNFFRRFSTATIITSSGYHHIVSANDAASGLASALSGLSGMPAMPLESTKGFGSGGVAKVRGPIPSRVVDQVTELLDLAASLQDREAGEKTSDLSAQIRGIMTKRLGAKETVDEIASDDSIGKLPMKLPMNMDMDKMMNMDKMRGGGDVGSTSTGSAMGAKDGDTTMTLDAMGDFSTSGKEDEGSSGKEDETSNTNANESEREAPSKLERRSSTKSGSKIPRKKKLALDIDSVSDDSSISTDDTDTATKEKSGSDSATPSDATPNNLPATKSFTGTNLQKNPDIQNPDLAPTFQMPEEGDESRIVSALERLVERQLAKAEKDVKGHRERMEHAQDRVVSLRKQLEGIREAGKTVAREV